MFLSSSHPYTSHRWPVVAALDSFEVKVKVKVTCGQVWWPILWICALHSTHPSAHTQQWTHTHHEHTPGDVCRSCVRISWFMPSVTLPTSEGGSTHYSNSDIEWGKVKGGKKGLYTIQIVSKQLHGNKEENNRWWKFCQIWDKWTFLFWPKLMNIFI